MFKEFRNIAYLDVEQFVRLKKLFRTERRLANIWANGVTIKSSPPWLFARMHFHFKSSMTDAIEERGKKKKKVNYLIEYNYLLQCIVGNIEIIFG